MAHRNRRRMMPSPVHPIAAETAQLDNALALDVLADRYANGSLRVTTRQSTQFHGVLKLGLKRTIAEINEALLTTLAACGDVVRTVTTVPAPIRDPVHPRLDGDARRLSTHLLWRVLPHRAPTSDV